MSDVAWSDPRIERAYQRRASVRASGTCPTCKGDATVFLSPVEKGRGHVYCDEDDCGWYHRNLPGIERYLDTGNEQ